MLNTAKTEMLFAGVSGTILQGMAEAGINARIVYWCDSSASLVVSSSNVRKAGELLSRLNTSGYPMSVRTPADIDD